MTSAASTYSETPDRGALRPYRRVKWLGSIATALAVLLWYTGAGVPQRRRSSTLGAGPE